MLEFDLSAFEASDIGILEVQDANGEPMMFNGAQVKIHMHGPGSPEYVKVQAKIDATSQARTFAALRGKAAKNGVEEQREDLITKLTACTKHVENFPIPGGAEAIYRNQKLGYITNQASRFLDDWANFQPASAKN